MPNETQVLLTNANVIHKCTWSLSMRCANADKLRQHCLHNYIKFEKLSDPDQGRTLGGCGGV
jgi:hypothetical protein